MYQLYYSPSTASMAPHILLEELQQPFELVLTDTATASHKTAEYLKLNPNGLIPTLVDGDLVLFETAAICLHLCDQHAEKGFMPAVGTAQRGEAYKWLFWLSATLQSSLILYFYPERWVTAAQSAAEVKAQAQAKVLSLLEQLEQQMASHCGHWFLGDEFSLLDIYAMMLCRWTRNFSGKKARDFPFIALWLQRMLARPAVKKVYAKENIQPPLV